MASVTLTTLRTRVRERADMVGSSFVADSATGLDAWINEANQKLHGMLVEALGEEYVSSISNFTTAGTDISVPSGFFKLYGVDLNYQGLRRTLMPYVRNERNLYREANNSVPRYALIGSAIRLYPVPESGLAGTILYAPEATVLVNASDAVNYPNGWERFIVLDAAIQALLKEESDVRGLMAERNAVVAEIEQAKENRDLAMPKRVTDTAYLDPEFWEP